MRFGLQVINTGSPFKFQVDAGLYDTAEWFQKALRGLSYLNPGPIVSVVDKVVSVKVATLSGNWIESQRLLQVRVQNACYPCESSGSLTEGMNYTSTSCHSVHLGWHCCLRGAGRCLGDSLRVPPHSVSAWP